MSDMWENYCREQFLEEKEYEEGLTEDEEMELVSLKRILMEAEYDARFDNCFED